MNDLSRMPAPACVHRLIAPGDIDATVGLMERIGVHFGGCKARSVLRAVARDGVRLPDETIIALATDSDDVPRGLVVAFTSPPNRHWYTFARRHPIEAATMVLHRAERTARRKLARVRPRDRSAPTCDVNNRIGDARALIVDRLSPAGKERWSDKDGPIAKVMYVAVDPSHRKRAIGSKLYRWFFRQLHANGFRRCDAQVSSDNIAAIELHRQFPFTFNEAPGGYFLWLSPDEVEPE